MDKEDSGASLHTVNILYKEGPSGITVASSPQQNVAPQKPVKKQTRQWAAWTRQEEESFFTALRQVGKNFEKITYRVQSKNKDQVRHYYYRLVRRMNKLLGPELCLDAKNSKDTNAAMLRWWSLLEKYSCKASKLHLKPRRFKIFLDTLEHQLLKDRRKNIRKRHSQGENCSTTASTTVFSQGKASGNDSRADKVLIIDNQNIQKSGSGKGSSLKRNVNIGINRSNCKGDSAPLKTARPRKKPGTATTTAAYKRWEKAAIAGVSLVADAAEHLERTSLDEVVEHVQGEKDMVTVGKVVPSLPTSIQNLFSEYSAQTFKLKLQLFPADETTRKALELDNHNPHLELTLSSRKKISSVVEHLNRKWGKSSIACGELVLLPYCLQWENPLSCQRWSQDSVLSAADVHAQIGSPSIFRLRYCWLSDARNELVTCQASLASPSILDEHHTNMNEAQHQNVNSLPDLRPSTENFSGNLIDSSSNLVVSAGKLTELASSSHMLKDMKCTGTGLEINILESPDTPPVISPQRDPCSLNIMRQVEEKNEMRLQTGNALTPGEWADSLTNISMGDLLAEASVDTLDNNCNGPSVQGSSQYLQQVPFSCDSFDAAIAALIYKHEDRTGFQPTLESHAPSSIWDAEETCDAFSFQKNSVSLKKVLAKSTNDSPEACKQSATRCLEASGFVVEEFPEIEEPMDEDLNHEDPIDEFQPNPTTVGDSAKYHTGLSDLYWSESLGALDLDLPSCKYHNEDLILSDSMSGLNRLIASSLDAFQNCSFFSLDKKGSASTVEARESGESVSFSDSTIGSNSRSEISKV